MNCPLCNTTQNELFAVNNKKYYNCASCGLTYSDAENRLWPEEEKKRYSFHQNNIDDAGYVGFLNRIIEPSLKYISAEMCGLDYGCGPNPVLAQILNQQHGIKCDYYDPFFFPEIVITKKYDFIFATECFEHFFSPQKELGKICNILTDNGLLCIMTELKQENVGFEKWYYKNDPTHVCFYNLKTINYICDKYNFEIIYSDNIRTFILKRI